MFFFPAKKAQDVHRAGVGGGELCRVSFWFWREIGLVYILMYLEYNTVVVVC